ncbi:MAG TPA: enolase [Candidatus Aenigmarchaeota archaeon]|nr:enolase [Candidatus Aenigmarchaeota archaeon]
MKVSKLRMRKVLNSKSLPTIEVETEVKNKLIRTAVPSGTSVGKYEVKTLSVERALRIFPTIRRRFEKKEFSSIEEVDSLLKELDGTKNFSRIGGNVALAISSVFLKAFTIKEGLEVFEYLGGKKLPRPLCNVAGGWGKENEIQEFLLYPQKQRRYSSSIFRIAKAYVELGKLLKKYDKTFKFGKNYESAWVASLPTEKLLSLIKKVSNGLVIGLDVAANDRWDGRKYLKRSKEQHFKFLSALVKRFDIAYVEDPFHEDDFDSFAEFLSKHRKILVCGDDLLATNPKRLEVALKKKSVNAVIVKPNQIGTITDTIEFVKKAKKNNVKTVMSHRSGTTDDTLFAHLAVGLECDFAKFGVSGERIVKLNELIRIEEKLSVKEL